MSKHPNQSVVQSQAGRKARSGLSTSIITSRDELQSCAAGWNELLADSEANNIFLTWEWISTWLDEIYPDAPLLVVAVRAPGDKLVALAPFYISELHLMGMIKYRCLRVLGDCLCGSDYPDLMIRNGYDRPAITEVLEALLSRADAWDCLWLPNVADWTGGMARLQEDLGSRLPHISARQRVFSAIALPESYEELAASFSPSTRSNLKRQRKNLAGRTDLHIARCETVDEVPEFLDALFDLHRKRWESVGQAGSFVRKPPMERFYRRFAPKAMELGWLRLFALRLNGDYKAVQFGYAFDNRMYCIQEGCDIVDMPGAGNYLRSHAIKSFIAEGISEYDFLAGFAEHKRRWRAKRRYGADLLIGRKSRKNSMLFWKQFWPTGRFINQGRPACEGRSYD